MQITGSATEYVQWLKDQADAPERDEQLNELLMHVAHLERVERIIEKRTPLTTAIRRGR
jgi:hypothetical protein